MNAKKYGPSKENSTLVNNNNKVEENQTPCLVVVNEEKQCLATMVKPLPRS